jgi:hypothetical protein
MGRLLAAIARIMSAMKTVWEWCGETGRLVSRQVLTLGGLVGGSAPEPVIDLPAPRMDFRLPDVERTKKIKRLAAAMDAPDVDAAIFMGVDDPVVTWLSAMTKEMRGLVASAPAIALEDHMKGRATIRGLLAFDRASVKEWKEAGGGAGAGGRGKKPPFRAAAASGFGKMPG